MIERVLTLVAAMHITASVFINDDESGLHHDYEVWLEGLAPYARIDQYRHIDTGEGACPERSDRNADAHLKRNATHRFAHHGPRSRGGGDERPAGWFRFAHQNLWHLGADLSRPGGMAGP